MSKPMFGMLLGGILGIFDGLTALVSAPDVAPQIVSIVVGSMIKGFVDVESGALSRESISGTSTIPSSAAARSTPTVPVTRRFRRFASAQPAASSISRRSARIAPARAIARAVTKIQIRDDNHRLGKIPSWRCADRSSSSSASVYRSGT